MDYFLFDFSGVQFHYTMSQKLSVAAARSHAIFMPYSPLSKRKNSASSITVTPNCCAFSSLLPASAPAMT